ncbi:TlyA family RNA methyltransferase [Protaetiibacter mangrovi]|uniref:TlyA family RNA methyltransferase n=1 Tax=Protaetiibacter mangrovi TaxID=2970926 RepID=A0ABT1ZF67_9MICO|nr:TlyA family RNA methyltransferase [Protaetiibacter mangrovi]MCS0499365.1 TlyA family RNA methyltransferase [Protaetiibacter mangrovi]TPW99352.1 TlyA family RNA methyltransferase [Schumannella luteola]
MPDTAASVRLDAELVRRGLSRSRAVAVEAIANGLVTVDGRPVAKASTPVTSESTIEVAGADHYVSRGAHKLIAALDAFDVDPAGRVALDAGASTGGFTQVLLERGASRVFAVDVGHGQLASKVQEDPRVANLEGWNLRHLTRESPAFSTYAGELAQSGWPSLVVGDLSFISLTQVLEPLAALAEPDAELLLLVKPQFEVGRGGVREGIVRDRALRHDAATTVLWAAWDLGLGARGIVDSPIPGGGGNREYLVHLHRTAPDPSHLRTVIPLLA